MTDRKKAADAVDDPPTPDAQDAQRPAISELDAAYAEEQPAVSCVDRDAAVKALYFIMQSVEVTLLLAASNISQTPLPPFIFAPAQDTQLPLDHGTRMVPRTTFCGGTSQHRDAHAHEVTASPG